MFASDRWNDESFHFILYTFLCCLDLLLKTRATFIKEKLMLTRKIGKFIFRNFSIWCPEFAFCLACALKKNGAALPSSGHIAKVPSHQHSNKAKICFTNLEEDNKCTLFWVKLWVEDLLIPNRDQIFDFMVKSHHQGTKLLHSRLNS